MKSIAAVIIEGTLIVSCLGMPVAASAEIIMEQIQAACPECSVVLCGTSLTEMHQGGGTRQTYCVCGECGHIFLQRRTPLYGLVE